jgi:two-component system OmpR family response regulator
MTRVLFVDDEARIRDVVEFALRAAGYQVVSAGGGAAALEILETDADIDLVILDVLMPDMDGLEVCRRIRARRPLPIIFLSSRGEETDRVVGLELGGDDYVTKPFSPRELVARVRSVLRRARGDGSAAEVLVCGELVVDVGRHQTEVAGEPVDLTATELRLLAAVLAAKGRVLSRKELIERAYPGNHHVSARTVDTHVRRIRGKLRPFAIDPFATVTGVGYRAPFE